MTAYERFSSIIIGDGTLPIQCAEILLSRGHTIEVLIGKDPLMRQWAEQKDVPFLNSIDDLPVVLQGRRFDYLFSIVNVVKLSTDQLQLARKAAINWHDAPLPRFAGKYSTAWAIISNARIYGVTWHLMTADVDRGDILKQPTVEISPDETTYTLNVKCYEAAIDSFRELVDELATGQAKPISQDLSKRSFFPSSKRPASGGVISWNSPAVSIDALVRGLTYGPYPNMLGTAKVAVAGRLFIVHQIAATDCLSTGPPGTIQSINPDFIRVCTADCDLELRSLSTIEGRPITLLDFAEQCGLHEGYVFKDIAPDAAKLIEGFFSRNCKSEHLWQIRLESLRPATLPCVRPTPSTPPAMRSLQVKLPEEVEAFIEDHRGEYRRTDFLLLAFAAYLSRITGVDEFDLGYSDHRLAIELDGIAALFAHTVPLRISFDCAKSLLENLDSHQSELSLVRDNCTYPRDMFARYPSLRTEAHQSLPVGVELVERTMTCSVPPVAGLRLVVAEGEAGCIWAYDANSVDEAGVNRAKEQFLMLLSGAIADPGCEVRKLPVISQAEQRRLLVDLNATYRDYPNHQCLHHLFEAQAVRTPEAEAVVLEDRALTYCELNARANQLAHYLQTLGVGPEVVVAICVERPIEMIIGVLGILKAGGAYLPLDPAYPKERLAFMLEDTAAPLMLTQLGVKEQLPDYGGRIVALDADWLAIERESAHNPPSVVTPRNMAYVIYTSGSTGTPKGVCIEHHSPVALMYWGREIFTDEEIAGALASTSICFDVSVFEMFFPLSFGGKVIVVANPLHLATTAAAGEVRMINTVPSAMAELLKCTTMPSGLMTVNYAGEPLSSLLVDETYRLAGVQRVFDIYGPSETTTYSTFALRSPGGPDTIGRPIANTRVYVLDRHLNLVPFGDPGELYIGGAGVARGYLDRPELTDEKFIRNPFSDVEGDRLYKTGDLVSYLPDGNLKYLERIDHQVKIRGFRIELGEIEAVLGHHPSVQQCVVLVWEPVPGDKRLVAYVVPARGAEPGGNELRHYLEHQLPESMRPSIFVMLKSLPLTPSGKVDRRALPEPDRDRPEQVEEYLAPRTAIEAVLADMWTDVLGLVRVGVRDNFFLLGGHSLNITQIVSRIRQTFRIELPMRTLFQVTTIERQAELIAASESRPQRAHKIASVLQRIKAMSADEKQLLLEQKRVGRGI